MRPFHAQRLAIPLPEDPLAVAKAWLSQAFAEEVQPNPNAMVLASADLKGQPSARVVLCKDIILPAGIVVFFTNYESHKGRELSINPRAAAVFHWDNLHRQVRVEGVVVKSPAQESDEYVASRPWQSRIGAWASQQSRPVGSREELVEALRTTGKRFTPAPVGPDVTHADDQPKHVEVPRPPHWGGFQLWAEAVELWVEGDYRIHDRARWVRTLAPNPDGTTFNPTPWRAQRLQP